MHLMLKVYKRVCVRVISWYATLTFLAFDRNALPQQWSMITIYPSSYSQVIESPQRRAVGLLHYPDSFIWHQKFISIFFFYLFGSLSITLIRQHLAQKQSAISNVQTNLENFTQNIPWARAQSRSLLENMHINYACSHQLIHVKYNFSHEIKFFLLWNNSWISMVGNRKSLAKICKIYSNI